MSDFNAFVVVRLFFFFSFFVGIIDPLEIKKKIKRLSKFILGYNE